MKRLLFYVVFIFSLHSICTAQQESVLSIRNKVSGTPSHEKYTILDDWIIKRFKVSEKLGLRSFDSVLLFMPDNIKMDAGRYTLDYLEGGLSEQTRNTILDSIYNLAVRKGNGRGQCELLRYYNGRKLGSYKAELDSAYTLGEQIGDKEIVAANLLFHGNYYYVKSKFDSAIYFYKKSLAYYLGEPAQHETRADLFNNLASTYLRKGKIDSVLFFYKLALGSTKDTNYIGRKSTFINVANAFTIIGRYDSALYYLAQNERESKNVNEPSIQNRLYRVYTHLFCDVNDAQNADKTARSYLQYALFNKDTLQLIDAYASVSVVKQLQHDIDSAFYYSSTGINLLKFKEDAIFKSALLREHGRNFLLRNNVDSAFYYVDAAFKTDSISGASINMAKDIYEKGNIALYKKDTLDAFNKFVSAKSLLQPVTDISLAKDIFHALSISAFALHHVSDAWMYQNMFIKLNDSLNGLKNKYALHELDARYNLSEEQQKVKNLTLLTQRNRLWITTGVIFFALFMSLIIFLRINYKNKMTFSIRELQQKALRAQLNPHFIFNVMQSIKNEYAVDIKKGEELLVNFSLLIREVLNKSFLFETTLDEEINLIQKYINVQSQHTSSELKFNIETNEGINAFEVIFPSLVLQPIVENAIKYGAINNNIVLHINKSSKRLIIKVENDLRQGLRDNLNTESSGTGLQLTKERINLFNKKYKAKTNIQFEKTKDKFITTISLAYIIKKQPELA